MLKINKLVIAMSMALMPLSACAQLGTSPADASDKIILDQKIMVNADLLMKGSIMLVDGAMSAGLLKDPAYRARAKLIIVEMKSCHKIIKLAYATSNSASYMEAWGRMEELRVNLTNLLDRPDA
jgi:hypothetical protein